MTILLACPGFFKGGKVPPVKLFQAFSLKSIKFLSCPDICLQVYE